MWRAKMSRAASAKLFPPTCSQDNAKPDATVQSDFRRTCSEEAFFIISVSSGRFLQRVISQICSFPVCQPWKVVERTLQAWHTVSLKARFAVWCDPFLDSGRCESEGFWIWWDPSAATALGFARGAVVFWWYRVTSGDMTVWARYGYQEKAGVASIWCWAGWVWPLSHF